MVFKKTGKKKAPSHGALRTLIPDTRQHVPAARSGVAETSACACGKAAGRPPHLTKSGKCIMPNTLFGLVGSYVGTDPVAFSCRAPSIVYT